jgi:putative ubiquitin-RnfH superfamily antitoxin RatB of RatAB toxin-antitoxin module
MENNELIIVECVYASPSEQVLVAVKVKKKATVEEVVHFSGLLQRFPEIKADQLVVGIFGQQKMLTDLVERGDRVEIYRPLLIDPMEARRQRAPAPKRRKF